MRSLITIFGLATLLLAVLSTCQGNLQAHEMSEVEKGRGAGRGGEAGSEEGSISKREEGSGASRAGEVRNAQEYSSSSSSQNWLAKFLSHLM